MTAITTTTEDHVRVLEVYLDALKEVKASAQLIAAVRSSLKEARERAKSCTIHTVSWVGRS